MHLHCLICEIFGYDEQTNNTSLAHGFDIQDVQHPNSYEINTWLTRAELRQKSDIFISPSAKFTQISPSGNIDLVDQLNLMDLLKATEKGKDILNFYDINKSLDETHRITLITIIVNYYFYKKIPMTMSVIEDAVQAIGYLFPTEDKEYYLQKRGGGQNPLGKLHDKAVNSRTKLRRSTTQTSIANNRKKEDNHIQKISHIPTPEEVEAMNWLIQNYEPWEEVENKWRLSFKARAQDIRDTKNEVFKKWPLYKHSYGHKLVEIDYSLLHPENPSELFNLWPQFTTKATTYFSTAIKDKHSIELLSSLNAVKNNGYVSTLDDFRYLKSRQSNVSLPKPVLAPTAGIERHHQNIQNANGVNLMDASTSNSKSAPKPISFMSSYSDQVNIPEEPTIESNESVTKERTTQPWRGFCPNRSATTTFFKATDANLANISIKDILTKSVNGTNVLKYYQEKNELNAKYRKILANTVSEFLLSNNITAKPETFNTLSSKIVEHFTTEPQDLYYFYNKGRKPGGTLYANYHRSLSMLRRDGLMERKLLTATETTPTVAPLGASSTPLETSGLSEKTWLKHNTEPIDEVLQKWKATYVLRRQVLQNTSSHLDFLDEWPSLKESFGHSLIELDFQCLYPGKENALFQKWESFCKAISLTVNDRVKDPYSLQILQQFGFQDHSSAIRDAVIVNILHAVLIPTSRRVENLEGTNKKSMKKLTISDSRNAFFLYASNLNELKLLVKQRSDNSFDQSEMIQPIICALGESIFNLTEFYVCYANIFFKLESILKCLDICFKAYHVLGLKYPTECKLIWYLIQHFCFDISLKTDEKNSSLIALLSDLKKFHKQ